MTLDVATRRRPRVRIAVLGESVTLIEPSMIVTVQTQKSLAQPEGVFSFTLKSGVGQLDTRANAGTDRGALFFNEPWFAVIRPNSLVYIAFGTTKDLAVVDEVFQLLKKGGTPQQVLQSLDAEKGAVVQRAVVMAGLVSTTTVEMLMGANGPQRVVRIDGKDLTKILVDDSIRVVFAPTSDVVNDTVTSGMVFLGRKSYDQHSPDIQEYFKRLVFTDPDSWESMIDAGKDFTVPLDNTLQKLLDVAPSLRVTLANGRKVRDYLSLAPVDPGIAKLRVRAYNLITGFQGSPWEAVSMLAPMPLAECFVDTVGFGAQLIVRRPPFLRPSLMQGADEVLKTVLRHAQIDKFDWRNLWTEPLVGTTDQFLNTPLRVMSSPANQAYHTVPSADIVALQALRSDSDLVSQIQVVSEVTTQGPQEAISRIAPVLIDVPAAIRFGTRNIQRICPWWPAEQVSPIDSGSPEEVDSAQPIVYAVAALEATLLYYYERDNMEYASGQLTFMGRPEVHIGDRVYLPDHGGVVAYAESVAHTYDVASARPYLTQVNFTRGQPRDAQGRLAPYDQDPPL